MPLLLLRITFCAFALVTPLLSVSATTEQEMAQMLEMFDRLDKIELNELIENADACTLKGDYACAEAQLTKATKLATSSSGKATLSHARVRLSHAREQAQLAQLQEARNRQACDEKCTLGSEHERCYQQQMKPYECADYGEPSNPANHGLAILQGMNSAVEGAGRLNTIQAQSIGQLQALQAAREQEQRYQRERQQQRDAEQRATQASREQEQERSNLVATAEQRQREDQQARLQQQEREQQNQADTLRKEQARLAQEQARADQLAKQAAERQEKQQAKAQFLAAQRAGTRLQARQCYGGQYIVGTRAAISPNVVSCIDVHYRAQCTTSNSNHYVDGIGKNFVGIGTDCFTGDTYEITPALGCDVKDIQVTVREVRECGE